MKRRISPNVNVGGIRLRLDETFRVCDEEGYWLSMISTGYDDFSLDLDDGADDGGFISIRGWVGRGECSTYD